MKSSKASFDIVVEIPITYPTDPDNPHQHIRQLTNPEPLFCLCGGIDDDTPMIECSNCHDWFHLRCIDMAVRTANSIGFYACPYCIQDLSADIPEDQVFSCPSQPEPSAPPLSAIVQPQSAILSSEYSSDAEDVPSKPTASPLKLKENCFQCKFPILSSHAVYSYDHSGKQSYVFCSPRCRRTFRRIELESRQKSSCGIKTAHRKLIKKRSAELRPLTKSTTSTKPQLPIINSSLDKEQVTTKKYHDVPESAAISPSPQSQEPSNSVPSGKYTEIIRRNVRLGFECIFKSFNLTFTADLPERLEAGLWQYFRDSLTNQAGNAYRTKYRSLSYNLKDAKNEHLREQLVKEILSPDAFVTMSPEELANQDMSEEIRRVRELNLRNSILSSHYIQETVEIQALEQIANLDSESDRLQTLSEQFFNDPIKINTLVPSPNFSSVENEFNANVLHSLTSANSASYIANRIIDNILCSMNCSTHNDSSSTYHPLNRSDSVENANQNVSPHSVKCTDENIYLPICSSKITPTKSYLDTTSHSSNLSESPVTPEFVPSTSEEWIFSPNSQLVEHNLNQIYANSSTVIHSNAPSSIIGKNTENELFTPNSETVCNNEISVNSNKPALENTAFVTDSRELSITESKRNTNIDHNKSTQSHHKETSLNERKKMKKAPSDPFFDSIRKLESSDLLETHFPVVTPTLWTGSIELPSVDTAKFSSCLVGTNCIVNYQNIMKKIFSSPDCLIIEGILPVDVGLKYIESILLTKPIVCFRLDCMLEEDGEITSPFNSISDSLSNEFKIGVVGHSPTFAKDVYLVPWSGEFPYPSFSGNIRYISKSVVTEGKFFLMFVSLRGQFHISTRNKILH